MVVRDRRRHRAEPRLRVPVPDHRRSTAGAQSGAAGGIQAMSKKAPSGVITLPRYLNPPRRRYVTRSGSTWGPETVALCFALTLRNHGTVEAVRATARRLVDKVCMEHQPNMKKLARGTDIAEDKTIPCALAIINRV